MTSSRRKETPEVAASEVPKPIPHVTDQKGKSSMTHNPVDTDDHSAAGLLRTAAELTALADRWLVAAEKALPDSVPLFCAVDVINATAHLRKAADRIARAEAALNIDTPHPVDPTGPLTIGTIPDADLDRLIDATIVPSNIGLDDRCCLGYPDSEPCNKPALFYSLSADPPDLWDSSAGASLGSYCSLAHAQAERRPSLQDAQRTHAAVVASGGADREALRVWQRLIESYPNPIQIGVDQ